MKCGWFYWTYNYTSDLINLGQDNIIYYMMVQMTVAIVIMLFVQAQSVAEIFHVGAVSIHRSKHKAWPQCPLSTTLATITNFLGWEQMLWAANEIRNANLATGRWPPANTRHSQVAVDGPQQTQVIYNGTMLAQRLQRWPSIVPTTAECLVFAGEGGGHSEILHVYRLAHDQPSCPAMSTPS